MGIQKQDATLAGEPFYNCIQLVVFTEQNDIQPRTQIEVIVPETIAFWDTIRQYRSRRQSLIASGVSVVEINLLREAPLFGTPNKATDELQLSVLITSPKPPFGNGTQTIHHIELDKPLPTIVIPFLDYESELDLNERYNAAFRGSRLFAMLVDYEKLPVNFERYSKHDQKRIKDILERIGKDLG